MAAQRWVAGGSPIHSTTSLSVLPRGCWGRGHFLGLTRVDTSALLSCRMSSSGMFGYRRATCGVEICHGGRRTPVSSRRCVFPMTSHILTPTRLTKKLEMAFCRPSAGAITPAFGYGVNLHTQLSLGIFTPLVGSSGRMRRIIKKYFQSGGESSRVFKRSQRRGQI